MSMFLLYEYNFLLLKFRVISSLIAILAFLISGNLTLSFFLCLCLSSSLPNPSFFSLIFVTVLRWVQAQQLFLNTPKLPVDNKISTVPRYRQSDPSCNYASVTEVKKDNTEPTQSHNINHLLNVTFSRLVQSPISIEFKHSHLLFLEFLLSIGVSICFYFMKYNFCCWSFW